MRSICFLFALCLLLPFPVLPLSEFWRQGAANGMFNLAVRAIYHSPSSFWGNKSCSIDKTSQGMNKPTENTQLVLLIHPETKADEEGRNTHQCLLVPVAYWKSFGHEDCELLRAHVPFPQHHPANTLVHGSHQLATAMGSSSTFPSSHESNFQGEMDLICVSSRVGRQWLPLYTSKVPDVL